MARPIWTGSLSFGLVNVPVELHTATDDRGLHFHQLEQGTADRIRYRRVNERTGDEVPRERIVRAIELDDGAYVEIDDGELQAVAPARSTAIEIVDFVDLADIDPAYFRTTYYLAPRGDAARHPYALLRAAMERSGRVGIACFVLRGSEHLVAVRPDRHVLALETMYFADEVRDPRQELPGLPDEVDIDEREMNAALLLIDALGTSWDPSRYRSRYRDELRELVEGKRAGHRITPAQRPREPAAQIVDLMEALDASIRSTRRSRAPGPRPAGGGADGSAGGRHGSSRRRPDAGPPGRRSPARTSPARDTATRTSPARTSPARDTAARDTAARDTPARRSPTRAELARRATELGIAGRSTMDRDALERAVRRAGRHRAS